MHPASRVARFVLLAVATGACGAGAARPSVGADARVVVPPQPSASARTDAPDEPKRATRVVPASSILADDLAPATHVLVVEGTALHPTLEAARADTTVLAMKTGPGALTAYAITASGPSSVTVRTGSGLADCVTGSWGGFGRPSYAVDAFVAREHLVARLAEPIHIEHADGTGVHVERGAPARVFVDGHAELVDTILARAAGPLAKEKLALATPARERDATSRTPWGRSGEALACAPFPEPVEQWRRRHAAEEGAKRREQTSTEERKRYEACLTAEKRGARAEAQARPPTKRPGEVDTSSLVLGLSQALSCDRMLASGLFSSLGTVSTMDVWTFVPPCSLVSPDDRAERARFDGRPFALITSIAAGPTTVLHDATRDAYLAEATRTCGVVRVEVAESAVGSNRTGEGMIGTGRLGASPEMLLWPRLASVVTWPDGTRAGTVSRTGSVRASDLSEASGDRLCTKVAPFAARLCHARADLCKDPHCTKR